MKELYIITATSDPKWYRDSGNKTIDMTFQYYAESEAEAKQQFKDDKIISRGLRILNIATAKDNFTKKIKLNKKIYMFDEKRMKYRYCGTITEINNDKITVYDEKNPIGFRVHNYLIEKLVKWHNEHLCDIR